MICTQQDHSGSVRRCGESVEGCTASANEREGSAGRNDLLTRDETRRHAMSSDETFCLFSFYPVRYGIEKKKKRRITPFSPVFLGQGSRVYQPLCSQSISSHAR